MIDIANAWRAERDRELRDLYAQMEAILARIDELELVMVAPHMDLAVESFRDYYLRGLPR